MAVAGFGQRIKQALLDYASQIGESVPNKRIAAMIADEEGRETPYAGSMITEWIKERSAPQIRAIEALARISGKAPGWLAFGDDANVAAEPMRPSKPRTRRTERGGGVEHPARPAKRRVTRGA